MKYKSIKFDKYYNLCKFIIFSIITPVFSVTWSSRNQSNMLIWCSIHFSYYLCLHILFSFLLHKSLRQLCSFIFFWTWWYFHISLMNKKLIWLIKWTAFIWKVFLITLLLSLRSLFAQCNVSLLNQSINFRKKDLLLYFPHASRFFRRTQNDSFNMYMYIVLNYWF